MLPEILSFELDSRPVLVADGAWLLPSFIVGLDLPDTEVRCIFLRHATVDDVATALAPRLAGHPPQDHHLRMHRQIWQYGAWICEQSRVHDLPVVDSLPFATLTHRAGKALAL